MSKSVSDHSALFGELRSALEQPPSAEARKALWRLTMRWPDDEATREQLVPYGAAELAAWPDALLVSPALPALEEIFFMTRQPLTSAQLAMLCASPGLGRFKQLGLHLDEAVLRQLLECERLHPQARAAIKAQRPSDADDEEHDEARDDGNEDGWE